MDILEVLGPGIRELNSAFHTRIREAVQTINENYLHARNASLGAATDAKYPIGLYVCYEIHIETHTNLETGFIRWRYGRFAINKSRSRGRQHPITYRVPKSSRTQIHYSRSDFEQVPLWRSAPNWEQRLVLYTEKKLRPLREALQSYKEAQRHFLYAPPMPDVDLSFDDYFET